MSIRTQVAERVAKWAIKSMGDRMTADQLVTTIFGPASTGGVRMGSQELLKAYSTMPWLRAVVGRTSWSTSCVPWQLYVAEKKPDNKSGRRKAYKRSDIARSNDPRYRINQYKALRRDDALREITDHPALVLLDKGNPRFPGQVARQVLQQHLDLIGEGAWLLERNGMAMPSDIYPIPPTWIAQTPWDRTNGIGGEPGNWIIHSNRGTMQVPKEDVIYFYHPDPADPYDRGRGTGHSLGDELETDEATAKHLKRWFKNFAIPPLIISKKSSAGGGTGSSGGGANVNRLQEAWESKLLGRNNVPYFSSQELSVHELNQTFNDMQLSQLRKDERDILIHVYGLPPEVFGILENSNRSTIDAADYLMAKYVVVPRLEFQRIILQQQLIERYDERLILDYVSPIVEDKEFELKVSQAHPYSMTVDEIRELAGRRKLENGMGEGFMTSMANFYTRDLFETGMGTEPAPVEDEPTDA
jgi:hypothetical protein